MLKDLKKTSKHTFIYALGNISVKVIGLVLIPIYTNPKYLSHVDYGVLAILEATVQLLVGILTMAMVSSLTRWYWDKSHLENQKSIFFTSYSFLVLTVTPVIVSIGIFSSFFSELIFSSSEYANLLKLTFIAAGIQVLNNQTLCLVKIQSKSLLFSAVLVLKLCLSLSLILWGIIVKGMGLEAIWQAYVIAEIFILIILVPYNIKNSSFYFHRRILKEMIDYGLPLMLASVSSVLLAVTDRYMLSSMSGLEKTGIYSLGFRIASTLKLTITKSLMASLSPLRMKKMNEPNNQRFYSKITTYAGYIFLLGLILVSLFSLEGLKLFTGSQKYWAANGIVPIISFGLFFGLLKNNTLTGLSINKKTKIVGLLIFITSLINIGLNILLIPLFDIYGAALATLFSQLFFFIIISFQAQKSYFIPYEWRKIGVMVFVSVLIILIGIVISPLSLWIRLPLKLVLFSSFPFVLYFLNFYEASELDSIKKIFHTWKNPKMIISNIKRLINI